MLPNLRSLLVFVAIATCCQTMAFSQESVRIEDILDRDVAGFISIGSPRDSILKLEKIGLNENEKFIKAFDTLSRLSVFEESGPSFDRLRLAMENLNELHVVFHGSPKGQLELSLVLNVGTDVELGALDELLQSSFQFFSKLLSPEAAVDNAPELMVSRQGNWFLVSNSKAEGEKLLANLKNGKSERALANSRRFMASAKAITSSEYDVFVFLHPVGWRDLLIDNGWIVEREWNAKAFKEISLVCFGIDLAPDESKVDCRIAINGYAAFTQPRTGLGTVLEAYVPIEKFPPMVESPQSVTAVRKNNKLFMERNREIFDAIHGNGVFDRMSKSFWFDWSQGLKTGFGGTEFSCWYGGNDYFTNHLGYRDLKVTEAERETIVARIDEYFRNKNRTAREAPVEKEDIAGYPAWFLDEQLVEKAFLSQRPYLKKENLDDSFELPNPGAMIWNDWQVFSNKSLAEKLLNGEQPESATAPSGSFGLMYKDLVARYSKDSSPFYIESHWRSNWEIRQRHWQSNLAFYLFPDSGEILRKLVYEADKTDRTLETDDPKENLINIFTLATGAFIDEFGQTTLMLTKTEDENLRIALGLFKPAQVTNK